MDTMPRHDDSRCWVYCRPIADAIRAGLEGAGEVTLRHAPFSAPIAACVRFPEIDVFVHFDYPIWTVEDAQEQLPTLRYRVARALELKAAVDGHD